MTSATGVSVTPANEVGLAMQGANQDDLPYVLSDESAKRLGLGQDLLSLQQTAARLDIGLSFVKQLIRRRELFSVTLGARRLVPARSISALIERLLADAET